MQPANIQTSPEVLHKKHTHTRFHKKNKHTPLFYPALPIRRNNKSQTGWVSDLVFAVHRLALAPFHALLLLDPHLRMYAHTHGWMVNASVDKWRHRHASVRTHAHTFSFWANCTFPSCSATRSGLSRESDGSTLAGVRHSIFWVLRMSQ